MELVNDLGNGLPAEQTSKILTQAALASINKIAGNLISHSINFQWTVPDIAAEDPEDYNIYILLFGEIGTFALFIR